MIEKLPKYPLHNDGLDRLLTNVGRAELLQQLKDDPRKAVLRYIKLTAAEKTCLSGLSDTTLADRTKPIVEALEASYKFTLRREALQTTKVLSSGFKIVVVRIKS